MAGIGKHIRFQRAKEASKATAATEPAALQGGREEEAEDQSSESKTAVDFKRSGSPKPVDEMSSYDQVEKVETELHMDQSSDQNSGDFEHFKRAQKAWSTEASVASEPRSFTPSLFEEEQTLQLEVPAITYRVDTKDKQKVSKTQSEIKSDNLAVKD